MSSFCDGGLLQRQYALAFKSADNFFQMNETLKNARESAVKKANIPEAKKGNKRAYPIYSIKNALVGGFFGKVKDVIKFKRRKFCRFAATYIFYLFSKTIQTIAEEIKIIFSAKNNQKCG